MMVIVMVLVMISSTTYDVISFNRLHSIKLQYVVMMKTKEREERKKTQRTSQKTTMWMEKNETTTYHVRVV